MKKHVLLSLCLMVISISTAWAQSKEITGKVIASGDNSSLPGVNVVVKGTTQGATTNLDGQYKITVGADAESLEFSFIGFETKVVPINGRSTIDVSLDVEAINLKETVITANAIKREKKELGYAVTTVGGEETRTARDANVMNSLKGKVPGVRITSQSGSVGGGSKVIIRGASSLSGGNQPLYVIDGVPISNSGFNGDRNDIISGGVDVGNRAADINPDDIESMTVLKSGAAAAQYGSRAKNGVIIITTKRGARKGAGAKPGGTVTVNSSLRFDNVLKLPDFQNEYASGDFGQYDQTNFTNGWGPKINGQTVTDFKGDQKTLTAQPDNVKDFYQTGITRINSVSFANGDENGDFRFGYTNLGQTGTVPNSELDRNTFTINTGRKVSDKLDARLSLSYIRTNSSGKPAQGSNDPNIVTSLVNGLPRTEIISDLENNLVDETGAVYGVDLNRTVNNPYWITENNLFTQQVDRIFGNAQLDYGFTDDLKLTYRLGTDFYNDKRRHVTRKGTINALNGKFETRDIFYHQVNSDLLLSYSKQITEDIGFKGVLGHNVNQIRSERTRVISNDLVIDELYTMANAQVNNATNYFAQQRLYGVFADVTFDYKDFLFVGLMGRNDWNSTLPEDNRSYFYPALTASFIFTEVLDVNKDILRYGKIRANFASVGSSVNPYSLQFTYDPLPDYFVQYLGNNTYPHGGQLAFGATDIIPNAELKPQSTLDKEFGFELNLLKGRLYTDFTYYDKRTTNQILNIQVPQSTGFALKTVNVGEVQNNGIEFLIGGTPVQMENGFQWDITLNITKSNQKVLDLGEGIDEYTLTSGFSGIQIKAEEGESFGLYGTGWARDSASGKVIINPNTGLRQAGEQKRLGDIYPDWMYGINNTFKYKGLSVGFTVDIRQGGVMYSATAQGLRSSGLAAETAENRDGVFIDDGVVDNGDGTYSPNTTPVHSMQEFWTNYSSNSVAESNIYDASFVKLAEFYIAYDLPKSWLNKLPIHAASFGVEGRNLWIIKDHVPHVDPEANFFGTSLTGEGVEFNSVPSNRSIGFNLRLTL